MYSHELNHLTYLAILIVVVQLIYEKYQNLKFYLNYNSKNEFIIDLDNIWKWLGFSTKQKSKELLEKNFIINKDYTLLTQQVKQSSHIKGGHNKETFMLNIKTFKKYCLKAGTKINIIFYILYIFYFLLRQQ